MGLCFSRSFFSFKVGVRRVGGGAPMCSRAADFTALAAENVFFLRRGISTAEGGCATQSEAALVLVQ